MRPAFVMVLAVFLPLLAFPEEPPRAFGTLRTSQGAEYFDCHVIRAEPDALLIRHRVGIARISFFHLPEEIRNAYGFDPSTALDYYQAEKVRLREIRWRTFWDKQQHEANAAAEFERLQQFEKAAGHWIPVEAKVVQRAGDKFLARCKRVIYVRTQRRSKLGFIVDGPLKRRLIEFAEGRSLLLQPSAAAPGTPLPATGSTWKGYVAPLPEGDAEYFYRGKRMTAPLFRAATHR